MWWCWPQPQGMFGFTYLFQKSHNSLDNRMLPFGLTRCASLLRTRLKALLDATRWTCNGDLLGWKGRGAAADASQSHHQLNSHSGCFLTRHLLVRCKMAACILDSHWPFLCLKEHVICWIMLWFSWRVQPMENSHLQQLRWRLSERLYQVPCPLQNQHLRGGKHIDWCIIKVLEGNKIRSLLFLLKYLLSRVWKLLFGEI